MGANNRSEARFMGHVPEFVQSSECADIFACGLARAQMPVVTGVAHNHAAPLGTAKVIGRHSRAKLTEI